MYEGIRSGEGPRHGASEEATLDGVRAILNGLLDPVVAIDEVGTIRLANHSCRGVFGHDPEELVGRNVKVLMTEPYRSEHDGYLARFARTGHTNILGATRAFPALRKDGRRIQVELSVSRLELPDGSGSLFCGSFRDVTARVLAEQALAASERRFHAIFDEVEQFVGLLSPKGLVQEINRTALEAIGRRRQDVVGQPFWETPWWSHSAAERDRLRRAVERAAQGERVRFETTNVLLGGRIAMFDFSLQPLVDADGTVVQLLPEAHDITEIRATQEKELAMSRAFAEIGESASLLAHEIKNPITAVNAALRAVAGKLEANEQEIVEELAGRMQRLESLMRRTLTLAKPLPLERRLVDVRGVVRSVARVQSARLEERRIALELDLAAQPTEVFADHTLLEEVVSNLVGNAVEAIVDSPGTIRLGVHADGNEVVTTVDDDGPGLGSGDVERIFLPFVSEKPGGTGIGLPVSRKIVRAHGGTITAGRSALGGARFEVRLPAAS